MNYKLLIIAFLLSVSVVFSQTDLIEVNASLETESFHRTIIKPNRAYFLRAVKHNELTQKKMLLTCLETIKLNPTWEKEIILDQYQNVLKFESVGSKLLIFLVEHDLDNKLSTLNVLIYDSNTGNQIADKEIFQVDVGKWQNSYDKAEVAQSFISAMDSKQNENEVTPLEFRFYLEFSNDSSRVLAYRFDNSQDRLYVDAQVYDTDFNLLHKINYSIDESHLAYGAKVDDLGEVYQLKVSVSGDLVVLKINPKNEVSAYLKIPESSIQKTNPTLHIHKSHQAYVAYNLVSNDKLKGFSVALLDFDLEKVEDSHSYTFDAEFLKRQEQELKNGNHFFELSDIIEAEGKLYMVLEQHFIEGIDVHYEPNASEKIEDWHFKTAIVTTGNIIMLVYDKELNPLSCNEISKTQSGSNFDGLNTLGHHLVVIEGEVYFIYSNSSKGILNDQLIVQKMDNSTNKLMDCRKVELMKGHVAVITSSNLISSNKILVHSRKGLTGKSNYLKVYEF